MTGDSKTNWVMVTGAAGGIGSALVDRLAKRGFSVIASAREPARLPQFAGPGRVVGLKLDLEQPSTIEAATGKIARPLAEQDCTASSTWPASSSRDKWRSFRRRNSAANSKSTSSVPSPSPKPCCRQLKQAREIVVNIGAISAHLTVPFYGPIAASKSALASLNDAMRLEFAQFGVKVFLIEPGAMMTGIFSTSRRRRDADLSNFPEAERRYRPALAAFDRAFQKAGADDPKVVADAVMKAFAGRGMKPRAVVGKGTGALLLLSRLPIRLRDRMVKSALGLSGALNPAG